MGCLGRGVELVVLGCVVLCVFGFNVDVEHAIIREPDPSQADAMGAFGASVTIHETKGGYSLLVGDPKYTWKGAAVKQGAIFKCTITGDDQCKYETLEQQLTLGPSLISQIITSDQLFGQTLISSQGNVMVCSPLFRVNTTRASDPLYSFYPVGRCLLFDEDLKLQSVYSPTTSKATLQPPDHSYVEGQFGFSAAVRKSDLVVGCPRCFQDTGSGFVDTYENVVNNVINANEQPTIYDAQNDPERGNYLGFSVAVGGFFGVFNAPIVMYALGRPKAENMRGQVVVVRSQLIGAQFQLVIQTAVSGDEVGAMFGYDITVADLNNDGFSDLIVGAPFYGDLRSPNMGRIVAYLSDKQSKFNEPPQVVNGRVAGGLFGLAVSSVGDLDLDNFEDVAVAAPFLGTSQNGEVHIYRGSSAGLRMTGSQVITFMEKPLKSFGFALSNAVDIDDNKYPDILVGAYEAQKVVLLRTRPVVTVTINAVAEPESLKIDQSNCTTIQGMDVPCFKLLVSLNFDVQEKAANISSLNVEYTVFLDTEVATETRLIMQANQASKLSQNVILKDGETKSESYVVYVQQNIRNKLSEFVNKIKLDKVSLPSTASSGLPELDPVHNADKPSESTAVVAIRKDCLSDVCMPRLAVEISECETLSITAGAEEMSFHIEVENSFESSYGTELSVIVDTNKLVFSRANFGGCSGSQMDCDPSLRCEPSATGALCEVGNPLKKTEKVDLTIVFRQKQGSILGNEGNLMVKANASSVGEHPSNNKMCTINVAARVAIVVDGSSIPSASWNIDANQVVDLISTDDESARNFTHLYRFKNNGPSPLTDMKVRIWWPVYGEGQRLLLQPPLNSSIIIKVENAVYHKCDVPISNSAEWPEAPFDVCKDRCMPIDCEMKWSPSQPLLSRHSVFVNITSAVNLRSLLQYAFDQQGDVSNPEEKLLSYGQGTVSATYNIDNSSQTGSVETRVLFNIDVQECVEIWIPIASGLGAMLLLAVAVLILYGLGFFRLHKRHSLEIRRSRSSVRRRPGASGGTEKHEVEEKEHDNPSSARQSKSEASGDWEEVFKKGAVEEPGYENWRTSGSGPDTFQAKEEQRRQSQSSHSQTTV